VVVHSLFPADFFSDQIIEHFHRMLKILEREIAMNNELLNRFYLWKNIGPRITDEEYVSSKQQARKKNPNLTSLMTIYATESVLALTIRCLALVRKKIALLDEFKDVKSISKIFKRGKSTCISFLLVPDIFDIWSEFLAYNGLHPLNQSIESFLPAILETIEDIPTEEISIILQQNLLTKDLRKLFGEFYTPPELAQLMVKKTFQHQINYDLVLEPSCGAGILLEKYHKLSCDLHYSVKSTRLIGIEINPIAALLAKFTLFFSFLHNSSDTKNAIEPLIFCADSLLSYVQAKGILFQGASIPITQLKIEFLGTIYPIILYSHLDHNFLELRKGFHLAIHQSILNAETLLKIPDALKQIIQLSPIGEYMERLVVDRICAVLALDRKYDVILGNPPYMRLQSIHPQWKRKTLTTHFTSATGHFDLYYLFIELGCNLLSHSGILTYITSNKFLHTTAAKPLRNFVSHNTSILEMLDFSDSHVFDAAVLPVIFILSRDQEASMFNYVKLQRRNTISPQPHSIGDLIDLLTDNNSSENLLLDWTINSQPSIRISNFTVLRPSLDSSSWNFVHPDIRIVIEEIEAKKTCTFEEIAAKISVGIKTTANYAFIDDFSSKFIEKEDVANERKEIKKKYDRDMFFPLIKGRFIRDFQIRNSSTSPQPYIFYPHYKETTSKKIVPFSEEDIPVMLQYFRDKGYHQKLAKREYIQKAKRKWWEIWNHKDPDDMEQRLKIVVPDISPKNNFAIDYNGRYVAGSAYFILLKHSDVDNYKYILGLLNSSVCEFYHKIVSSNTLYAGRYRYWSSNMKKLPVVRMNKCKEDLRTQLINVVSQIEQNFSEKLETRLNNIVFNIFNLSPSSRETITHWIKQQRI
jgi:hypothetical protein